MIRYADWELRYNFNVCLRSSSSDLFRNILAFYLTNAIKAKHKCLTEYTVKHIDEDIRPNILIMKNDIPIFVIEVKTTLGWDRDLVKDELHQSEGINKRIDNIANRLQIKKENIIYCLESVKNVRKNFQDRYWDSKEKKPKPHPDEYPFCQIYQLYFINPDPYHWKNYKPNMVTNCNDSKGAPIKLNKSHIRQKAKDNIITSFEMVIEKVRQAID